MICFKSTFAFTVTTKLLHIRVGTPKYIDLAKYNSSEVTSVAQCNHFNSKDKPLHDASLIRNTSVNA